MVPDLVEHFGIKEEKITPIHLGINREDFAPISEEKKRETLKKLGLHINTYSKQLNFRRGAGKADDGASNKAENSSAKSMGFFLFIGTLQPRKNVERLIDAFSLLPTDIQQTYPLVIVGRSGWSAEKTEEKLKKLIDKGVAHWLGYISFADKVALLQTASALVFPSLYEGFGLPVLEAFASRLPVITSTVSSLPEVAGDAAYLVDPLDIEALSHAMSVVVQNPHYFQPLIEKGYARAAQMTWARCVEKTVSVYKQIIQ
jgi:alpha-1,3-rhamnosyl/mannosyltransferase